MGNSHATRVSFKAAGLNRHDVQRDTRKNRVTLLTKEREPRGACLEINNAGSKFAVCVKERYYTTGEVNEHAGRNFLDLDAFLCRPDGSCDEAMQQAKDGVDSPVSFELYGFGNEFPSRYYIGDFNKDGLADVLAVFPNGQGVAFTQQKAK